MKNIFIFILAISFLNLSAQETEPTFKSTIKFGIFAGAGSFDHGALKTINQQMMAQLPFKTSILDEFEPSLSFGAFSQYELLNRFLIGPEYHYYYSGSRLGTMDYSGKYSFTQYLHSHSVGLKLDYVMVDVNRLSYNVQINAGASFSDWKMERTMVVGEIDENQVSKLKGLSWYLMPAFVIDYEFIPQMSIFTSAGYSFDLMKNYKNENYKNFKVTKTPDWSGLKLSLGLKYTI